MSTEFENDVKNNYNVHDNLKNLSVTELKAVTDGDRLPYAVATFNVNGNLNIGIMIRNAVTMGAERFIVFGKRQYDRRSCVGSYHYINIDNAGGMDMQTGIFDYNVYWSTIEKYNYIPVYIEQSPDCEVLNPRQDIITSIMRRYGKKPCFIFGSESHGIPKILLDTAQEIYCIEQRGVIRSLNVSSASAIVMWSLMSSYQN